MAIALTLPDQLLLLSLNDIDGSFEASSIYLSHSLIGAGLAELMLNGHISIENKTLISVNNEHITSISHPFLAQFHAELQLKWEGKKTKSILQHFVRFYAKYQKMTLDHLIALGVLEEVNRKILWVFNSKKYPEKNSLPENLLRSHLKRVVSGIEQLTERDICLFKFLKSSGLLKQFKPEEKKLRSFQKEIEQLIEQTPISPSFKTLLKEIEDNIITAIVMITVVT